MKDAPQRIVCLSAEAADWLWRIGAWERVVGVTAYFQQPAGAAPKPRVSGFSAANIKAITALNPDLIVTFSDVQAKLAAQLIQNGFPVFATNQRTLEEIEQTLELLGRVVGRESKSVELLAEFHATLAPVGNIERRPRVYFEEWHEPLISGIAWVSELIERAGGTDIFPEIRGKKAAVERAVTLDQVAQEDPEIILASWCGKPVKMNEITNRPGWGALTAVRHGYVFEIPSDDILQPGFRLIHGYDQIKRIIADWRASAVFTSGS